jgi:hypothetical protein
MGQEWVIAIRALLRHNCVRRFIMRGKEKGKMARREMSNQFGMTENSAKGF